MKVLVLDLELNKTHDELNHVDSNTTDIIQVGACVLDTESGDIVDTFSSFCQIRTPLITGELRLSTGIVALTGIKDSDLENAPDIVTAYNSLIDFAIKNQCSRIPATWGAGDLDELRHQIESHSLVTEVECFEDCNAVLTSEEKNLYVNIKQSPEWFFSKYNSTGFFDVKKIYQSYRIANNLPYSGGLRKAMNYLGLTLPKNTSYHNAMTDSIATAMVYQTILQKMRLK